jgi:hypothetical protein
VVSSLWRIAAPSQSALGSTRRWFEREAIGRRFGWAGQGTAGGLAASVRMQIE